MKRLELGKRIALISLALIAGLSTIPSGFASVPASTLKDGSYQCTGGGQVTVEQKTRSTQVQWFLPFDPEPVTIGESLRFKVIVRVPKDASEPKTQTAIQHSTEGSFPEIEGGKRLSIVLNPTEGVFASSNERFILAYRLTDIPASTHWESGRAFKRQTWHLDEMNFNRFYQITCSRIGSTGDSGDVEDER